MEEIDEVKLQKNDFYRHGFFNNKCILADVR